MNPKSFFLALSTIFFVTIGSMAQQKPFVVTGVVDGLSSGTLYFITKDYSANNKLLIDSVTVTDSKFTFKGVVDGVGEGWLSKDKTPKSLDDFLPIIISHGNLTMNVQYNDLYASELRGTLVQDEAFELQKMKKGLTTPSDVRRVEGVFIDKYPSSLVTATILQLYVKHIPYQEAKSRYDKLPVGILNTPVGVLVTKAVTELRSGSAGVAAFDFTSADINGEQISLSDFKGKYVLLDFWASWCVPCRAGNPHLLELYAAYKDKGFEIIGVSDNDSSPDSWKKAVQDDKISGWRHILRSAGQLDKDKRVDILKAYGITSLPTKILIDPDGVIIARFGGGSGLDDAAMDKMLAEIFSEN